MALRQWVTSFPFALRFLFATHPHAMGKVLGIVYRTIATHLVHKADAAAMAGLMGRFRGGAVQVPPAVLERARAEFSSAVVDDERTCETIASVFHDTEYLLDPHTAIGVRAAREGRTDAALPLVTLGTAHPAKFPDAIHRAGVPREPQLPLHMVDLLQRPERCARLPRDLALLVQFVRERVRA